MSPNYFLYNTILMYTKNKIGQAIILCGGQGTRIRDVADSIPKPMISIGDLPILWHIMKYYSLFGYNRFILALGYNLDTITELFLKLDSEFIMPTMK